jgi:hypothetical protein
MGESQYSFSLTTFSPSGKLAQIEYALNAVSAGVTSLGISATDGVVIATEKKLPSVLVDEETVQKIQMVSPNIGVVYSGMGPDFRVLVRRARKTAQVGTHARTDRALSRVVPLASPPPGMQHAGSGGRCPPPAHAHAQAAWQRDRPMRHAPRTLHDDPQCTVFSRKSVKISHFSGRFRVFCAISGGRPPRGRSPGPRADL